jgi:magnesium-transporting ATPase (P-type)
MSSYQYIFDLESQEPRRQNEDNFVAKFIINFLLAGIIFCDFKNMKTKNEMHDDYSFFLNNFEINTRTWFFIAGILYSFLILSLDLLPLKNHSANKILTHAVHFISFLSSIWGFCLFFIFVQSDFNKDFGSYWFRTITFRLIAGVFSFVPLKDIINEISNL